MWTSLPCQKGECADAPAPLTTLADGKIVNACPEASARDKESDPLHSIIEMMKALIAYDNTHLSYNPYVEGKPKATMLTKHERKKGGGRTEWSPMHVLKLNQYQGINRITCGDPGKGHGYSI